MPPVEAVLIGAGQRGRDASGAHAVRNPEQLKFVAVADTDEGKRNCFAEIHGIPPELRFSSYEDLFARPQIAPLCFNTTMDRMHLASTLAALEAGYHVFLEKPMAETAQGCAQIANAARELNRMVQICHPLRFTAFYVKVKQMLTEGAIGTLNTFLMAENVGYWHFAHSFVRGNWGRLGDSGPLVLTKTCHDMDIAAWMAGSPVKSVASSGDLMLFHPGNAPEGAPERCLDNCPVEKTCVFSAVSAYLGNYTDWPVGAVSLDRSLEARRSALQAGPYGKCVFRAGNDVVDNQVVTVEFENGTLLNFTVSGSTAHCYRTIRLLGTAGEIDGHFEKSEIRVERFEPGCWADPKPEVISTSVTDGAHGGGDSGVIDNFLRHCSENDMAGSRKSLDIAVEGHLLSFAAEEARLRGKPVLMKEYKKDLGLAG
jgi:predicted dehydrogenase